MIPNVAAIAAASVANGVAKSGCHGAIREKREFLKQYVLNRALTVPHVLEAAVAAHNATEAWDKIVAAAPLYLGEQPENNGTTEEKKS